MLLDSEMSADSNMGYNHDAILASVLNNRHSMSFQSGAVNSSSSSAELIPTMTTNSYGVTGMSNVGDSTTNLLNNNNNSRIMNSGVNSGGGGLIYHSASGLKHALESTVDWSIQEQSRLEEGLVRFVDEPSIMRYIKIAAILPEKTVRDVALRCRWMTRKENGKRRKQEEHYVGKKVKDRKENLGESSSQLNLPPSSALNMNTYSPMAHHMDQNDHISCEVLGGTTRHLLGENIQILSQISANLETFKIHDNVNLFCHSRNNLTTILNNLRDMPGIMSHMPPLPVSVNEDLVNSILPNTSLFGSANDVTSSLRCQTPSIPSVMQIHDNVNLFCQLRNNLTAILNYLRDMPGIMSHMPPLPVSVNEHLVNSILPYTSLFGSANSIYMKQEPRC